MTRGTSWGMGLAFGLVLGVAPHAAAQIPGWEKPAGWVPDPVDKSVRARAADPRSKNLSIQAGGGYTNFRDQGARGVTNAGAQWNLRAVFGFARPFGVEALRLTTPHL